MFMSKEIEREVRYLINDEIETNIINNCVIEKEKYYTTDIVVGYDGFNSLNKYGYIIRIRNKGEKIYIESKKRLSDGSWNEARISINDMKEALNFLLILVQVSKYQRNYFYEFLQLYFLNHFQFL